MPVTEILRNSLKVASEAFKIRHLKDSRFWNEGTCVKIRPKPFEEAIEEAVTSLPSTDNTLIYFETLLHMDKAKPFSPWDKAEYLTIAKNFLESKGIPFTVFADRTGNLYGAYYMFYSYVVIIAVLHNLAVAVFSDHFDLDEARKGIIICKADELAGTEFKSLIYVHAPRTPDSKDYCEIISRCIVNLVIVQIVEVIKTALPDPSVFR